MTSFTPSNPGAYAVIFDMDGVLVDSYRPHLESWRRAAARYGLSMTEGDFAGTFGRTSREIIRRLWPGEFADGGPVGGDGLAESVAGGDAGAIRSVVEFDRYKEKDYRDILAVNFPAMDGAGELVAALHGAGFLLAIGSSGPAENVALVRSKMPNGTLIRATVDGSEVRRGKPDPEVFVKAAGRLRVEPGRCAVIEDAVVGLQAAKAAGMTAIGLTGTSDRDSLAKYADLVVESLRELTPGVIRGLIDGFKGS